MSTLRRSSIWTHSAVLLAICLATLSPLLFRATVFTAEERIVVCSAASLDEITGGAKGICCKASQGLCGSTGGCSASTNKCIDAFSCPLANQNIKVATQTRYPMATCKSATGSLGTVNLAQIICYNTVACPQSCTKNGSYYYCDGGINPVPGPQVTPTNPDNTTCP